MKYYKKYSTISYWLFNALCIFFIPFLSSAQANIGGVVNTYYKVTGINTLQSSLDLTSTTGLALYDNIMIVQMKGATVNTSNSPSFGSMTAYNDAGNYEINVVCVVQATKVFLLNKIAKTYDAVNGFVQVVRIPSYANANVITPLQAQPWSSASGTGGVLGVIAIGTLTLQSNIIATDAGFRGGGAKQLNACSNFFSYTDYYYNTAAVTDGGNYKGESIAELAATYSGGRGANANGGGGGNDHNNGGGGGGNLTTGGRGGDNTSTVGCRGRFPAVGAYALSNAGSKIFLGGGAGMGHTNGTGINTDVGHGGGIVFIKADELIGNGYTIAANGSKGTSTLGDGAGGGGAGGTIIMDILNYTGAVTVEGNGGNGGDENNLTSAGRCYGSGGGGGAGVIYYSGAIPVTATNNVIGGSAGTAFNSNPASCNGTTNAANGANGTVVANYPVSVANTPETYCQLLLDVKYLPLTLTKNNNGGTVLKWNLKADDNALYFSIEKSVETNHWKQIAKINYSETASFYQFKDDASNNNTDCYRIKAVFATGGNYYSNVACTKNNNNKWLMVGNPVKDYLYINGLPAQTVNITLYDATGKRLIRFSSTPQVQPMQINVSSLAKGIYYIRCNDVVKGFLKE